MKSKATSKVVSNNGNKVTTTTAKVKSNPFTGKNVIKIKKRVDSYTPIANGGRVYSGSKVTKTKRVNRTKYE